MTHQRFDILTAPQIGDVDVMVAMGGGGATSVRTEHHQKGGARQTGHFATHLVEVLLADKLFLREYLYVFLRVAMFPRAAPFSVVQAVN